MDTPLSLKRKLFLKGTSELLHLQWSIISHGGFCHEGRGPRYVYEHLMEVCSLMTYIGDVLGYVASGQDGFVDPSRSHGPFVVCLMLCLEVTHLWCMRHPKNGSTPKDRCWDSHACGGLRLHSVNPISRLDVVKSIYPGLSNGLLYPDGMMICEDYELRGLFLCQSKQALGIAECDSSGQSEPLRLPSGIKRLSVFVARGSVRDSRGRVYKQREEVFLRLTTVTESVERVADGDVGEEDGNWGGLRLYWNLESVTDSSIYDEFVRMSTVDEGIE